MLNTFTKEWVIRVKVFRKYPMKFYKNQRGQGCFLKIDLMDKHKTQIEASFFNESAEKWAPLIQEGLTYTMSNGYIKLSNRKFSTIPNDFCISFDQYAKIEESKENGVDPLIEGGCVYNFTSLKEIANERFGLIMIDFIAVITDCQELTQIQLKSSGEFVDKMTITIADQSNHSINVSIWGQIAKDKRFKRGVVLAA